MRIPGIGRVKRAARRFRNHFTRKGLILLYHRIADAPSDPHQLCVSPRHFDEHLQILREHQATASLRQVVQALRHRHRLPGGVVVTFDDGYADNLVAAKPLLERRDVPATVFLATGYLGGLREFWWDEVERLVLGPGTLPEALHLTANGHSFRWDLGPAACYTEADQQRYRGWSCRRPDNPGPRHPLFFALNDFLFPLSDLERRQVLDHLRDVAGAETGVRPAQRTMTPDEVLDLVHGDLVDVGAHTMTHPVLALRPAAEQASEIQESKKRLEALLGRLVFAFAYPHGRPAVHYTNDTVKLLGEAGFDAGCSTVPALIHRGTDPLQLPRFIVFDWDGDEFARRLRSWLRGEADE
jgi:peptidoglycan/xylan/chitin deacetylase (PgdA/CDA1 family)